MPLQKRVIGDSVKVEILSVMAGLQETDEDIRTFDCIKYGGFSGKKEKSNHDPVCGSVQFKEGEVGEKFEPGIEKPFRLNSDGSKLSINNFPSVCLKVERPKSHPDELSNASGPLLTPQPGLKSKWTRLTRSAHEFKIKDALSDKLRECPTIEASDSQSQKRRH